MVVRGESAIPRQISKQDCGAWAILHYAMARFCLQKTLSFPGPHEPPAYTFYVQSTKVEYLARSMFSIRTCTWTIYD